MIFMEDTTGFKPGREQEMGGIVQAGRAMLDAIIDLRTPRFLVIIRNAFGGAYASYNNYPTGADLVVALPTTRVAVMGPAGVEFVFKDEVRDIRNELKNRLAAVAGNAEAVKESQLWAKQQEAALAQRYEKQLMNPNEALSLGSISQITMPSDLRKVLTEAVGFHLSHYKAEPMQGVQREFF
jgi:acetyl-CoA carboxylase carboxyltransferase component